MSSSTHNRYYMALSIYINLNGLCWINTYDMINSSNILILTCSAVLSVTTSQAAQAQTGKFVPPDSDTLFFIGQTSLDLDQFRAEVLSDQSFPSPTGITLYTNIFPDTCSGLDSPCSINGDTVDFQRSLAQYPNSDLAVGLFLSDNFAGCTNQPLRALIGREDADLIDGVGEAFRAEMDTLIEFLQNSGRRVFLRIGYEFDGPWNCYNAEFHKEAFRYVKNRIDALGADNIATVWQSASYPIDGDPQSNHDFSNPNHWDTWYPGDDVVDWIGMSTFFFNRTHTKFQTSCVPSVTSEPEVIYNRLIDFASTHNKPVLIAESTPVAYRTSSLDASCILENAATPLSNGANELWDDWFEPYFRFIYENRSTIRGIAYINSNWEAFPQFNCAPGNSAGQPNCTDGYWGNSRIQDNPNILNWFRDGLDALLSGNEPVGPSQPPSGAPSSEEPTPGGLNEGEVLDEGCQSSSGSTLGILLLFLPILLRLSRQYRSQYSNTANGSW